MLRFMGLSLWATGTLAAFTQSGPAQEWSRFRGPNGSGISPAKSIPTRWTAADYQWQVPLAGSGYSSPVIWGDRLFLTLADNNSGRRSLVCIDTRNGKTRWKHGFADATYTIHQLNSRVSATPALDALRVYVLWGTDDELIAQALTHDGKLIWSQSLGPYKSLHGIASSPIVHDGQLLVANDQDKSSSLMALNAATGEQVWSLSRQTTANYSTPCLFTNGDRSTEVIFSSRDKGLSAVDVTSGKLTWELAVFKSHVAVASPVVAGNYIVGVSGGVGVPEELVTIQLQSQQPARPLELYRIEQTAPFVPTPLVHQGMLFSVSDEGVAMSIDLASGKLHWKQRLQNKFYSSPICINGKLYIAATDGEVLVLEASDQFQVLARNRLADGMQATPAVAGNSMFLRTFTSLICITGTGAP
ncbi:MAG: PQQ-binding-like beta-propeller repeat protein [Planctomycetota bacterium]|nr:PQQ-binding-like beta-propeller repeat protein [Planctomycetota bacterium]